jgi:REP element-mobilizing transposase RayT
VVFRKLAEQKECRIEEGHLRADHVHMMISIPPKYSVSSLVGFIKAKSAIHLARVICTHICLVEKLQTLRSGEANPFSMRQLASPSLSRRLTG